MERRKRPSKRRRLPAGAARQRARPTRRQGRKQAPTVRLSDFLQERSNEIGPDRLRGAIVLAALDRPLDDLIRLALALGPYHPGERSPWSHTLLIAEDYRGPETRILDCTIRNKEGKVAWDEPLDELLRDGITKSGGIYEGIVQDYDDPRVTYCGLKVISELTLHDRTAIVRKAERLKALGYRYDLPGLVRELVRLLTGIKIPAGKKLLFCSAFCQATYREPLGSRGDFAPAVETVDTTPDDIWYSELGDSPLPPTRVRVPARLVASRARKAALRVERAISAALPAQAKIEHIVVLMLENRSFDHMLGSLSLHGHPVNGLQPGMFNLDSAGAPVPPTLTTNPALEPDPHHDLSNVFEQLEGPNAGFVRNYETCFEKKPREEAKRIMWYYEDSTLPALYTLAKEYGLSDAWHCSVPSETWPNRLFVHAATSDGRVRNGLPKMLPLPQFYELTTIFDRLGNTQADWRIYNSQLPQCVCIRSLLKRWLRSKLGSRDFFRRFEQFAKDCQKGDLPKYSFIEPRYFGGRADDDHPPHDVWRGQTTIASVYNSLRSSRLWPRSLLVVLYDEHGGFFDHVSPPSDVPAPVETKSSTKPVAFDFRRLGPRVPCLLVSPWISKGSIVRPSKGGFFDHTSILATVERRWNLKPLTQRDAAASDVWPCLTELRPRTDDEETAAFLKRWQPPVTVTPERMMLRARDTLRAPIVDVEARTPREIAEQIAAIRPQRARLASAIPGVEATHPLSDNQEALIDLAEAIVRTSTPPPMSERRRRSAPR
jgi:phospholipase C